VTQPSDGLSSPGSELLRPQGARFHLGDRPGLDGVRALAVILVMLVHLDVIVPGWGVGPVQGGFLGVDVFFVLSGFLITSLLCEEYFNTGRISFKNFYERRAFRLLPALYVVMVAQLIYTLYEHGSIVYDVKRLGAIFLYIFNWTELYGGPKPTPIGLGVMWSLAIEAQFYLFWPLLLLLLLRTNNKRVVFGGMAAVGLIGIAIRALIFHHTGQWFVVYLQTETRFDDLMLGAAAAYLLHTGWRPKEYFNFLGVLALAGLIAGALTTPISASWIYYGGYTVFALASVVLLLSVLEKGGPLYPILSSRPLRRIGVLSYALYLWHTLIYAAIQHHWPHGSPIVLIPLAFVLSYLAAALSYRFVESPFLRMKKRHRVGTDVTARSSTA
jgi:peptidoglycan/LPS O-acetylase OafA/YrhL